MSYTVGIVWNPSKVGEDELRTAVGAALAEAPDGASPEVLWFETTVDDPGQGATADALDAGCTVVVAAGGDGTVRSVAGALGASAEAERSASGAPAAELGIIPLGTGNLLARNLDVPLGDPRAAFARVLAGEARPLDLGEVTISFGDGAEERQPFVVMVGFGIDAQMIVETDDELKARAGWLAYVESLGRAANETEVVDFSLALDGGEAHPESAHTLLVANCGTIQGGITLLPDAAPDDGELDLLVLRADGVAAWLDTMRNLVWDNGLKRLFTGADRAESSESTAHLRARGARVELPSPHAFEVDGDDFEGVTAFEVRILPAALRVR
ncbi:diacylglycerol kinase family enzyme [Leucobacter komagatae]|uniref:Diacylglycerol kinase family enzyme n=1 Tax=Leucobacter komagatae TaxID=55969 RepID=A0A542Y8L6_9MICO|nr:diacylglycerol kinase family protein [Leucobacter komagatae]TQL44443.1 diacylglycerol kinase family enzyme [Leucobacter komagatae]